MNRDHAQRVYFEQIKRLVRLESVLVHYGVLDDLKRVGRQLTGCCPIHNGTNKKQFVVDLEQQVFRCFSPECDEGGSTLEFVAAMENVEVREAALRIAEIFAIRCEPGQMQPKQRRKKMSSSSTAPSYKVFNVSDREYKDPKTGEIKKGWWSRIGTAFPNKEGGHSITFDALPTPTFYEGAVQTRVVLRPFDSEDNEPEPPKKSARK